MNVILFGPFSDMDRYSSDPRGTQPHQEFVATVQQWCDANPNASIEHVAPLVVGQSGDQVLLLIFYRSS
jgi:hypothetical protein